MRNDTFLRALKREPTDYTPVWIMRQAGRYLPEYRELRSKIGGFMDLCRHVDMACQVSLQPLARFPLDAVILFSDILTIPDAMGLGLQFIEGKGPHFRHPVRTQADIEALPVIRPEVDLDYVCAVAGQLHLELVHRVPLIGFSGSPWTLASYMIEGQSPGVFTHSKSMMYSQPELLELLLDKLVVAVTEYLNAQIDAGVDVVQIFDTWGGVLSEQEYQRFSLSPMARVIEGVKSKHPNTPCIAFTKGGGLWLHHLVDCGADALGLDWSCSLGRARTAAAGKVALQGNLDPAILRSQPAVIRQQTRAMLDSYGQHSGHIANLGHGITPDINPDHAAAFINEVHAYTSR